MKPVRIWLRIKLPEQELASLARDVTDCELRQGDDTAIDPQWLREVDGVFTEEPLPDTLVVQMPNLKWLHRDAGRLERLFDTASKSPPHSSHWIKGRPWHGVFRVRPCLHLGVGEEVAGVHGGTKAKEMEKARASGNRRKTLGIVGLGTAGAELARKAKALGLRVIATKRTPTPKPEYVDELGTPEFCPSFFPSPTSLCSCWHPFHQPLTFLAPKNSGR